MAFRVYLTIAEVIEIHRLQIDELGGLHGLRDNALLESAVMRPQNGYYQNLIEEAAALMESLCNNHPFHDGNKRVSFVATDAMLRANGYELNVEPDEAYRFIMDSIANREFQFPQIRDWLIARVKLSGVLEVSPAGCSEHKDQWRGEALLSRTIRMSWGGRRGLNPRHSVPQTDALPAELLPPLLKV